MPLNIIRNDITKVAADVIVNTANPEVAVGAGVDSAIYKAAGPSELLAARAEIGRMRPGEAKATPAFRLDAKYIIHTVGPAWLGGGKGEAETVAACYRNSLKLAVELGAESIAFPLISTGTLGFPKDIALRTAISEISSFLFESEMNILLVVYNKEAFELSGKLFSDVKSYIEESAVITRSQAEGGMHGRVLSNRRESLIPDLLPEGGNLSGGEEWLHGPILAETAIPDEDISKKASCDESARDGSYEDEVLLDESAERVFYDESAGAESIDDIIKKRGETFQQHLFRLIDRRDLEDVKVYKKANIDRKLFSKLKSNVDYRPSKSTALAFAIALELNLDETMDLIGRAGYTFSPASIADLIICYCINKGEYDINEINCILFKYGQPTLGV